MQRTVNRIHLHASQQAADLAYWLAQPVQARIDAVETLRQQHHQGAPHVDTRLQEFAALLNSNAVEYMVVGGYALAAYGHPRYTGDLDFWVGTQADNADRVLAALAEFGFASLGIRKDDLTSPNHVIQLGYPPARIDLLTSIDGVDFAECCRRRMTILVDGVKLGFIGLDDFKTNKKAVGRHKDLADLEALSGKS